MLWHRSFSPAERGFLIIGLLRLADVLAVLGGGAFAFWLRNDLTDLPSHYIVAIVLGTIGLANVVEAGGMYHFQALARVRGQFGRVVLAWSLTMTVLIVIAYFARMSVDFSRIWAVTWFAVAAGMLVVNRVVAITRIERWRETGKLVRRIAVVGAGPKADRVCRLINGANPHDVALVRVFRADEMDELMATIAAERVDEIVVALPGAERDALRRVVHTLGTISVEVRYAPDTVDLPFPVLGTTYVGGIPLFDIHRRPLSVWSRVLKRVEDLVLASIILVLVAPLMIVIAVLVRLTSKGPALFRQSRLGFNNNAFTLYKFRTMRDEPAAPDSGTVVQARRDDARVTGLGRFLRRTSLDELPQLFNVIRGEMSLVGPRPHAIAHNREYAGMLDDYLARHRVKPGMTGWAQVNGLRGETNTLDKMRARVEHDLYYINHWSLWLDLKILVMTLAVGFVHRNAY
jgi:putative colanic acid biosynthesis UDP-glucose lipid carrier transferase